jgi:hypothetical protein
MRKAMRRLIKILQRPKWSINKTEPPIPIAKTQGGVKILIRGEDAKEIIIEIPKFVAELRNSLILLCRKVYQRRVKLINGRIKLNIIKGKLNHSVGKAKVLERNNFTS